jgi:hypothetical protein
MLTGFRPTTTTPVPDCRKRIMIVTSRQSVAAIGLTIFCCLLGPARAFAQSADLSGVVRDETAAAMSAVSVRLTNDTTGVRREQTTGSAGRYTFAALQPGLYRLDVSAAGFRSKQFGPVRIGVGARVVLDVVMEVAPLETSVSVNENATPLRSVDGSQGTSISSAVLDNVPINGRTLQSVLTMTPGLTLTSAANVPGQFSVNGQRATSNYMMIDGVSANIGADPRGRGIGQEGNGTVQGFAATGGTNNLISVDAIDEFRVLTSSYAPEYGRASGAQIVLASRRGSNAYHGSGFYFYRDEHLGARDWFVNYTGTPRPQLKYANAGGTLGGPIKTDDAWFFVSTEDQRVRQPTTFVSQTVSSSVRAEATGPFASLLAAYPEPTGTDLGNGWNAYGVSRSNASNLSTAALRVDARTPVGTVFSRFSGSTSEGQSHALGGGASAFTVGRDKVLTLISTSGFNAALGRATLFDARLNYSHNKASSTNESQGFPVDLLLPPGVDAEASLVSLYLSVGTPGNYSVSGANGGSIQRQINTVATLSHSRGDHFLKLGVDYRRLTPKSLVPGLEVNLQFANLQNALRGTASSLTISRQDATAPHYESFSAFVQDQWLASRRLTVTYGLRWDYEATPDGGAGAPLVVAAESLANPVDATLRDGPLWDADPFGFAPRVNATYAVSRWLTLKGGGGLFFDSAASKAGRAWGTYPFTRQQRLRNTQVSLPLSPALFDPPLTTTPGTSTVYAFPDRLDLPRSDEWTAGAELQLPGRITTDVRYVGSSGDNLIRTVFYDLATRRPDLQSVIALTNGAYSRYHGLQVQAVRRSGQGWQAQAAYTWGSARDNGSNESRDLQPAANLPPTTDEGPADFDVRHSLSALGSMEIGRWLRAPDVAGGLLRGLQLDLSFYGRTGTPFNALVARDLGYGVYLFRPDSVPGVPLYIEDPSIPSGRRVNRAAFVAPTETRQGTAPRNGARNTGVSQVDLALGTQMRAPAGIIIRLRAEAFNVFNTPHFGSASPLLTNALFGVPTSSFAASLGQGGASSGLNPIYQIGGPRSVQLVLRASF